jgi:hypothetical protein
MRQIRHVDHATIQAGVGFGTGNRRAINADPHRAIVLSEQGRRPDAHPVLFIDPTIFQRFIATSPLASEQWRERQFRQRAGRRFARERIAQFKESIRAALIALVDLMTNLLKCVKVQFVSALCLVFLLCKEPYFIWQFLASQGCLFG